MKSRMGFLFACLFFAMNLSAQKPQENQQLYEVVAFIIATRHKQSFIPAITASITTTVP